MDVQRRTFLKGVGLAIIGVCGGGTATGKVRLPQQRTYAKSFGGYFFVARDKFIWWGEFLVARMGEIKIAGWETCIGLYICEGKLLWLGEGGSVWGIRRVEGEMLYVAKKITHRPEWANPYLTEQYRTKLVEQYKIREICG